MKCFRHSFESDSKDAKIMKVLTVDAKMNVSYYIYEETDSKGVTNGWEKSLM